MTYKLDPKKAREADDALSQLQTSGLYVGKITQAKRVYSNSNTEGIDFTFEAPEGKANATIWTAKSNGDLIFGYNLVIALMTCLKVKNVTPVEAKIKEYDSQQGKSVEKKGVIYPDLCGEVAIIFQIEEYVNQGGDTKKRANIKHFFSANTFQTASEILDQVEAVRVHSLKDKYKDLLLDKQPTTQMPDTARSYGTPSPQNFGTNKTGVGMPEIDIDDDEIPF